MTEEIEDTQEELQPAKYYSRPLPIPNWKERVEREVAAAIIKYSPGAGPEDQKQW